MRLMSKVMTGVAVLALSTGFAAAVPAMVENDLNLRAGPGVDYPVVAAMPGGATVNVIGCEAGWCRVGFNGTVGWASRAFISGGAVAGSAYRGYGESYAGSYGLGGYGPGYGSYGDSGYRERFGYSEGERSIGSSERRFGEDTAVRGERRVGEETAIRGARRMSERGATRARGLDDEANARSRERRASEIKGANPMLNARDEAAAGGSRNARAEVRGNARAGAGSSEEGHGANFIGPGKKNVDNH